MGARFFGRMYVDRLQGPPSLLYNGYQVSFPKVKRPGRGADRSPLIAPLVSSVSAWNVMGQPLPFVKRNGDESMELYKCIITVVYLNICVYRLFSKYILGNGSCLLDYVRPVERNQSVANRK